MAEGSPALPSHLPKDLPVCASWAFCALAVVAGALMVAGSPGDLRGLSLGAVGALACGALLAASRRLRSRRVPSWTSWQRDPFLPFAGALGLAAVHLAERATPGPIQVGGAWWAIGAGASVLAAVGFLLMIEDLTPGRAVDALLLAGMVAAGAGLLVWLAAAPRIGPEGVQQTPWLLAAAGFDLLVVGLGVQALRLRGQARQVVGWLLLAWTVLLSIDLAWLLAELTDEVVEPTAGAAFSALVFGLAGGAALHPSASQAPEPIVRLRTRLPRGEVGFLGLAVVLGPVVLASGDLATDTRPRVLALTVALSALVVTYLVRLVQGRAVLEHRAHHDELTGLANGVFFEERADTAVAHARRTGGHTAVLYLDLDRFKNINDSLGHATGNLLLQAVARRLRSATRADDTVARLGGDEFAVLLPQIDEPGVATIVAEEVLRRFDDPFVLNGHRVFASPSIGIAVFPSGGDSAGLLLENADTAMYRAKQRGHRTHCSFDPSMKAEAHRRLALESELHGAVERGEMQLHYQPKVHLPSGRVTGMEALLRWQHPEHGLLMPSDFIPVAEESGLILPLGEWALEEACRQNHEWLEAGFAPLVVAVNVSLRQFQQTSVEDLAARALRTTGLDPELLELEVTESLAMHDPARVATTLQGLRDLGVMCSIDDFGTGYSGLSQLIGFPIDKLKIDKSFVATIDGHREAPIVVAVVALAHGLGLEVVAEGVETTTQLERLRELGCDEMQGYLFSRPLPAEHFEQLLMLESVAAGPGRLPLFPGPRLAAATA